MQSNCFLSRLQGPKTTCIYFDRMIQIPTIQKHSRTQTPNLNISPGKKFLEVTHIAWKANALTGYHSQVFLNLWIWRHVTGGEANAVKSNLFWTKSSSNHFSNFMGVSSNNGLPKTSRKHHPSRHFLPETSCHRCANHTPPIIISLHDFTCRRNPKGQTRFESHLDSLLGTANLSPFTGIHPCFTSISHVGAGIGLEEFAYLQVKQ